MKPLLLIGGGGHCHACIDVIETAGGYAIAGIIQPKSSGQAPVLGYPVLGDDEALPDLLRRTPHALITVGQINSPETRMRLFHLLKAHGAELPVIQAPTAYCSRHATLGEGSILLHGSLVNANARIGANCIINSQALVEHDARIADHCHIATGARVNGGATVSTGSFIGSGAILREGIAIGEYTVIGAGQVILHDLPPHSRVSSRVSSAVPSCNASQVSGAHSQPGSTA